MKQIARACDPTTTPTNPITPTIIEQLLEALQRARRRLHTLGDEDAKEVCADALRAAGVPLRLFSTEQEEADIAELAAWCSEITPTGIKDPDRQWQALLGCNAIGEKVCGVGPTAAAAIRNAHAICDQHKRERG